MDSWSTVFWFIIFMAISGYFSGTEIALASVNKIKMISYADNGDKRAQRVLFILDNFDKALTTLLIGTNIMHIACATLSTVFATKLWGSKAVAISTVVTTIIVFLVAEMIPKYFAKSCNERFALTISGSLIVLMKLMSPISAVFSAMTKFAARFIKVDKTEQPTVTEDELEEIIDNIAEEGNFDEDTSALMQSAMEFSCTTTKDIITPWDDVVKINVKMSADQVLEIIKSNTYSRLVVINEKQKPVGTLNIRRFIKEYLKKGNKVTVGSIMGKLYFVKNDVPIDNLIADMSSNKVHLAIAKDKTDKILGIVTIEDILEELVGEIFDEEERGGGEIPHE